MSSRTGTSAVGGACIPAEYFGPFLGLLVYDDTDYNQVIREAAEIAPYGLTGAVIAQDRAAIVEAMDVLRFAAGNFYINDKPTGAVVGQQPFGGARASGTNDKAGVGTEPAAVGITAVGEGNLRTGPRLPLPAHGMTLRDAPTSIR